MITDKQSEMIQLIDEAQEALFSAIELIEAYCQMAKDSNAKAYLLDHLKIMAGADHGFLSRDLNLDTLRDNIMFTEEDENEY